MALVLFYGVRFRASTSSLALAPSVQGPSGEITNLPYLGVSLRFRKDVIMSTGMAELSEIDEAIVCLEAGRPIERQNHLIALHNRVSRSHRRGEPPCDAFNGDTFGVGVGYSDHTDGIDVAIAAVAMGASVIEKHFTLDKSLRRITVPAYSQRHLMQW